MHAEKSAKPARKSRRLFRGHVVIQLRLNYLHCLLCKPAAFSITDKVQSGKQDGGHAKQSIKSPKFTVAPTFVPFSEVSCILCCIRKKLKLVRIAKLCKIKLAHENYSYSKNVKVVKIRYFLFVLLEPGNKEKVLRSTMIPCMSNTVKHVDLSCTKAGENVERKRKIVIEIPTIEKRNVQSCSVT